MSEQACGDGVNAPTRPLWYEDAPSPSYTSGPVERAGVCVVGAGIAGLTTAYLLANAGREVVVVDERPVGQGQTGRTSAHLSSVLDDRFAHLESVHGLETTRIHYESHAAAIDRVERIARDEGIECDFERIDGMLFPGSVDEAELEKEFEAARRVGVHGVEHARAAPSRGGIERACLRFPNQARFHPLRYLSGLTEALARKGVRFQIGTRVEKLSGDGPVEARLVNGSIIAADHAVAATNVPAPINWTGVYTKTAPYRTYVVAVEMPQGAFHDALWWDMEDPYHYVRLHRTSAAMTYSVPRCGPLMTTSLHRRRLTVAGLTSRWMRVPVRCSMRSRCYHGAARRGLRRSAQVCVTPIDPRHAPRVRCAE